MSGAHVELKKRGLLNNGSGTGAHHLLKVMEHFGIKDRDQVRLCGLVEASFLGSLGRICRKRGIVVARQTVRDWAIEHGVKNLPEIVVAD